MPVMGGVDALPLIRKVAPEAPVVVLSAWPESMLADMRALGAAAYHQKQEPSSAVADTIYSLCA